MLRTLAVLIVASVALADDQSKRTPYPATVTLTPVTVRDDSAEWVVLQMVPVQKSIEVEVERNGRRVKELRTVTEYVSDLKTVRYPLKELNASGVDGQPLSTAVLAKRLTEGGVAVMFTGELAPELRKAFKPSTVFVDRTPPPEK